MRRMLSAFAAKLFEFKTLCRGLLILRLEIVAILTFGTLKNNFVTHNDSLDKLKGS